MTFKETVNWLLEEGYLVLVAGRPVLTAKFEKEVGFVDNTSVVEKMTSREISNELIKPTTYTDNPKEVWNIFIEDASIPHRVSDGKGGQYTVRHWSPTIAKKLMKIISDPKIDYTRLVESTKHYYKTVTYKNILSNYIDKEIWLHEYESYSTNKNKPVPNVGGNPFEK